MATARYWTEAFARRSSVGIEEKVQKLVEMGFPEDLVRSTLESVNGDENQALEMLWNTVYRLTRNAMMSKFWIMTSPCTTLNGCCQRCAKHMIRNQSKMEREERRERERERERTTYLALPQSPIFFTNRSRRRGDSQPPDAAAAVGIVPEPRAVVEVVAIEEDRGGDPVAVVAGCKSEP
ncbi:hypothetical protein BHM03_00022923 [Ensete ventricosum]|nr:hypothetical protein BHM03_00022923 [Ensete ventricosum]